VTEKSRPRRAPGTPSRAILTATSRVLAEEGYEATTTTRVAEVLLAASTVQDEPGERVVRRFVEVILKMHAIDPRLTPC
jgi:hypothetical protein